MEDLPVLVTKLKEIAGKWHLLGVQLKFTTGTLDGFPPVVLADPIRALQELLTRWLQRSDPPPTLEALSEAVGGPVIGNELLAGSVLEQRGDFPSTHGGKTDNQAGASVSDCDTNASANTNGTAGQAFWCPCGKCSLDSFLLKGCPHVCSSRSSKLSFPYLDTSELDEDDRSDLEHKLIRDTRHIIEKFDSLVMNTSSSLIEQGVTYQQLANCVVHLEGFVADIGQNIVGDHEEEIIQGGSIDGIFLILRKYRYWSFLNCEILQQIINTFGNEKLKESLQKYLSDFEDFCKRSVFQVPSEVFNKKTTKKTFAVKLVETVRNTLEDVLQARRKVAEALGMRSSALFLCCVEKGCVKVHFLIPDCIAKKVLPPSRDQLAALHEASVQFLEFDGKEYICQELPSQESEVATDHPESHEPAGIGEPHCSTCPQATNLIQRHVHRSTESPQHQAKNDSFQYIGSQLFNTWPYHYFKKYYKSRIEHIVRLLGLVLLAYHFLAMTLVTMCEDGGFQSVFDKEEGMYYEVLHRLLMFGLRIIVRDVIPAVCLAQFTTIGAEVMDPNSGRSKDRAIEKLLKVHDMFSPRRETAEIRHKIDNKGHIEAFDQSTNMARCHIKAMWTTLIHSVLFTGLLLYNGAFFLAEEKIMMEGICNLKVLQILECASVFFTILLVGVTKDFYMYENRIAIYGMMIGGEATKLYTEVRRRWRALDCLCYSIPVALAGFVVVSFATGKPFTPDPPHELKAANLATWYFWVSALSVLAFPASSTNLTVRKASLVGDIFAILFSCMNHAIEGITITPDGDSIIVVLFAIVAVLAFNLLFSLCRCHYYHCDRKSRLLMWYCVLCMCILPVLVIATTYREVAHLAHFVAK